MDRRHVLLSLLSAAAMVFACGPRTRGSADAHATAPAGAHRGRSDRPGGTPAASKQAGRKHASATPTAVGRRSGEAHATGESLRPDTVDAALAVRTEGGVRFEMAVANGSKHRVELTFADGRTRDFVVYDARGAVVWTWSAGRMFTQGMQNKLLTPGDTVVYAEEWTAPRPGHYTVVAQLRSENYPMVRRATFEVTEPAALAASTSPTPLARVAARAAAVVAAVR